jgi:predicted dehydrogenase
MANEPKLKVGVVGTGVLGKYHTNLYRSAPHADLVGIYDSDPKVAADAAKQFNVQAFQNLDELVERCDALTVAVPATFHYDTVMPILAKGRHVLVEKPIASDVTQAREMVKLANEKGLVLAVGHVERFNPAMDFLEKNRNNTLFIEAHRLAKYPPPRPGHLRRGTEVSVVLDLMIHDLDLVLNMVGQEIEKFDAVGVPILSKTEDIANVRIKFVNGAVANITASRISAGPMRKFRVFQTDSYISMDYATSTGVIYRKGFLGVGKKDIKCTNTNALADEINNFVDAVIATKAAGKIVPPRVTGEQGLRALELADAICREMQEYNSKYGLYKFKK